jgi:uncharacterized membrane protein YkvA (DUF1232 family)
MSDSDNFDPAHELEKLSSKATEADVERVVANEPEIMGKADKGPLRKFLSNLRDLFGLLRAYAKGDYREVPWSTIAAGAATLLYILMPIDAIPDLIPGAGLVDDAAVLALALKLIGKDLAKYAEWRDRRKD